MEGNGGCRSSASGIESSTSHDNSEHRQISVSQETLKFLEEIFHDSGFDFDTRSEGCSSTDSNFMRETPKHQTDVDERGKEVQSFI